MEPRGITSAASGAEKNFPLGILDSVKPSSRPENVRSSGPDTQGRFSQELNREVNRLDNSRDISKIRESQPREGERTKESNLGNNAKGPEAAWDREGRNAVVEKDRNIGPAAKKEEATRKEPETDDPADEADTSKSAINTLKDWLAWFLEAVALARRVENPGPGSSLRLDEGQLGPRFAELTPTAITLIRGRLDALMSAIATEGELPLQETEAGLTTTGEAGDSSGFARNFIAVGDEAGNGIHLINSALLKAGVLQESGAVTVNGLSANGLQMNGGLISASMITGQRGMQEGRLSSVANGESAAGMSQNGVPVPDVDIEVVPIQTFADRLAELISKAADTARNLLGDTSAQGGKSGLDAALLFKDTGSLWGNLNIDLDTPPDAIKPIITPLSVTSSNGAGVEQWGFGSTLLNGGTGDALHSSGVTGTLKPGADVFAVEVEKVAQELGRDSVASVRLSLNPPDLGHLVITFRRDENGLRVEFHTSNPAVMKMLEDAGPKMMERLSDAGVNLGSMDVFLNNNHPGDQRTFSQLDNPGNPPGGITGTNHWTDGAGGVSNPVLYFAESNSMVDMLV